jgi:hypothetical protein
MNIKSIRRKRFILLLVYVTIVIIFMIITSLRNKPEFKEFFGAGLFITLLLANIIFFVSNFSTIIMTDDFVLIRFPIVRKDVSLKYEEIVSYDNTNAAVYLFKTIENKVFAIRKFEFKNYSELTGNISSKTQFSKINIFSNAKKGFLSYILAILFVSFLFIISTLV